MTIRIYPSQLPGEPLETHEHKRMTILQWFERNVKGFTLDRNQPVLVKVGGVEIPPTMWGKVVIKPGADVRIYPVPHGTGLEIAVWVAVAVAVVTLALVLTMDPGDMAEQQQGEKIDANTAKANTVKLHEPVPELLGQEQVYPNYVGQPITRFVNKRTMQTKMALCVGVGRYQIPASSMKIGDTPFAAFGPDISYAVYEPGASVADDDRFDNWYVVGEVGGTDAGTSGLDTLSTAPGGTAVLADALALAGTSVSLIGDQPQWPEVWDVGTIVFIKAPDTYQVEEVGEYDQISGQLDDLNPFTGMLVTLGTGTDEIDLKVKTVSPAVPPIPGVGGNPSSIQASASPETYDFTTDPLVWQIGYRGETRTISLTTDYVNMSGVVAEITSQLVGTGLVADDNSGRLLIAEPRSPYRGGVISQSSAPVALFGIGPVYTVGTASTGGSPGQAAYITLEYDDGTAFAGLPDGPNRISLGYRSNQYQIIEIDGFTATVQRLTDVGAIDTSWTGFRQRTLLDFSLSSDEVGAFNWLGPFHACSESELTDYIEYDISLPAGLIRYNDKGRVRQWSRNVVVQWRDADLGGEWNEITHRYADATPSAIGFTETLQLPYPMRPQVRLRRKEGSGGNQVRDTILWYGLRSRLPARPNAYEGVTTMGLTVRTGDRLGAQSDRKVNMVPTRLYEEGAPRSIYGATLTVTDGLGIPRRAVDIEQLQMLESNFWTPRGETFDYNLNKQSAVRDALRMIFAAGMSHLTLSAGLISVIREGKQNPKGMLTPGEMTEELKVGFKMPTADDFTGVDVKYRSSVTWAIETIKCRVPGVEAHKVETFTIDGVTSETRAWRIGMRRLHKYLGQRLTFTCGTEMDAWVYEYLDHIVLADDIPGTTQSTSIVDIRWAGDEAILDVDEPLEWDVSAPRVMIRRHDGSATGLAVPREIDAYTLAVPAALIDFDVVTDLSIEPARLLFGDSTRVGYPVMIEEISPSGDGQHSLTAAEYSDNYYADDDNHPPA